MAQPRWNVSIGLSPDYYVYMSRARFWASTALCLGPVWRAGSPYLGGAR